MTIPEPPSPEEFVDVDDDGSNDACPLTTPAFHFCFAVVRAAITASLSAKGKSPADDVDDVKTSPVLKGLAIINEHATMRGSPDEEEEVRIPSDNITSFNLLTITNFVS